MKILRVIRDAVCISILLAMGVLLAYGVSSDDPKVRESAKTAVLMMP
jgi:hypothetical protein